MRKLALGFLAAAFKSELITYDVKSTTAIRSLRNDMELDDTTNVIISLFFQNLINFKFFQIFKILDFKSENSFIFFN